MSWYSTLLGWVIFELKSGQLFSQPLLVLILYILVSNCWIVVAKMPTSELNGIVASCYILFSRKAQINDNIKALVVRSNYMANLVFNAVLDVSSNHGKLLFVWWLTFRPATVVVLSYDVLFALFIGMDCDSILAKVAQ